MKDKDIEEATFQREVLHTVKQFFSDKDKHVYVDIDAVYEVIWKFIEHRMVSLAKINDTNRYELFTDIHTKAKIIIEAWQQNFERELLKPSDTRPSLIAYIESTYGKFC